MNLFRSVSTIGGLTLASRVLGLVRDSLFARYQRESDLYNCHLDDLDYQHRAEVP